MSLTKLTRDAVVATVAVQDRGDHRVYLNPPSMRCGSVLKRRLRFRAPWSHRSHCRRARGTSRLEYVPHDSLSLYAAVETQTGAILGKTAERHTSDEFVRFLEQIVASQPRGREIHIIADNLSAHKTAKVMAFSRPSRSRPGYASRYASWLNRVELWFTNVSGTSWREASSPP